MRGLHILAQNTSRNIRLSGVRHNNLKNFNVEFPAKKITVVTGLSGSGKSSLAFDTLYAEGQRRYIESLSTYTRQFLEKMPKPEIESIENIPPSIALEQKNHVLNSRSTVGTQTEVVDYLRVLFAKVGKTFCLDCGTEVRRLDPQQILDWASQWGVSKRVLITAPLLTQQSTGPSKKKTKTKAVSRQSLFELLREQGYQRLVFRSPSNEATVLDLQSDLTENRDDAFSGSINDAIEQNRLAVVVDRIKLSGPPDRDTATRMGDSIAQALAIGQGRIQFVVLSESGMAEFKTLDQRHACPNCGREYRAPEPHLFSFNSPMGACQRCSGFGFTLELDENLIVPDPSKTIKNGAIDPFSKPSFSDWQRDLFRFCERNGISIGSRYRELTVQQRKLIWNGTPGDQTFPGIHACFEEMKRWKYKLHIRVFIRRYQTQLLCPDCKGARLKPEALAVQVGGKNLPSVLDLPLEQSLQWVRSLPLEWTENQNKIASEIHSQVERRLSFLDEVGVGYLTLSRLTKTLSGGEFQRICLATQLGNGLCGTLYVLDEPSIGLHASDTTRLIGILKRLRDQGNTVVVVEHDPEVIKNADWLVELGPGAGRRGGELVAQGTVADLAASPRSVTGKYLTHLAHVERIRSFRPARARRGIKITGCREHNLKNLSVDFPLDRFVVVTGVSGSGKSTLVHKTLHNALSKIFYRDVDLDVGRYDHLYGADQVSGIVLLDQTPIGKSSRSNPATYLKAWDEIRRLYATQPLALRRGYTPQHFSFNVDGGRCPVCKGEGEITLDMHFMAEVRLPCEECGGKRFKKSVLDISYRGKDVNGLLHTTIDEAYELFMDNATLRRKLGILREVGLGYLQLGQSSTTLSGGESQRLKIAATLDDRSSENLLYLFDEPTTGLHLDDVKRLLAVIQDLVDAGHSVIMIEHHLDMIAQADWVIDLGPGGGVHGGTIIAQGPPDALILDPKSITGQMLQRAGYQFPERELYRGG
ncbi:MAG: excinuclease ABC subunit UvrA [Oligoflexia bacterium]